ncbi:TIGR03087 family PEP-CTERM/XrtA system glycosyltransferase [Rhodoferax antarcticus]|uniref:Sugar transferase, PEP-CTERM/EpsH1 system associated n=1 Tax=Rhodoferax antarcticus ANT.BR TaxID=1111071 RepID=A0A1Q8YH49_9BURK|nr:TIGR03087 family PEP-CTERM/XrtA system glycosyltransferase [Rhodoferax antarcticus]APW45071.1 sugar transferase [Rhodoferax antarcticus]MCW2313683.1 sugar transferase (PEP-CTERM/EpsH1 system associated) [Rhodoferax antarcticus]OLP07287.1 Sugar transferase, PEP-CTERM/EpsH1 system associated [Rhodoferax antarcticus ANT.BR]
MGKLLYLVHRLPYPPNKGDKVRSYHLLKHLTQQHQVYLGTFIDDPADEVHLATVRALCPDLHVARLNPRAAKLRSLAGLLTQQSLSQHYYQNAGLQTWVQQTLAQHDIDAVVIFSSVMAQYIDARSSPPMLVDFVDVDSAKWTQYAPDHRWPLSWLYHREGARLLAFERRVAQQAKRSFFVTDNEAALFRQHAPESGSKVDAISNGVDAEFFSPDAARLSPYAQSGNDPAQIPLVFTGAMDYWPNIDAVTWFVADILPALRQAWPSLCFYIVGRNPTPAVQALAGPGVVVTGTVDDVRPYLQHAAVVVAPLRVARGIQNKILEAMAMARPVVASTSCAQAITAEPETELLSANAAAEFIKQVSALLASPERCTSVGVKGRQRVLQDYSWHAHLSKIDQHLSPTTQP